LQVQQYIARHEGCRMTDGRLVVRNGRSRRG
jgi:hypothetical protein